MRFKIIDGFLGGSHKKWAEEYANFSKHEVGLVGLSAKYWKWRMQGAAIELSGRVNNLSEHIDLFICSDMLNLPLFKSLLDSKYDNTKFALYMHENQLSYPWSPNDPEKIHNRDFSYGFLNYSSALVADQVCFNSNYHRISFLAAARKFLKIMPDHRQLDTIDQIEHKSIVLPIGADLPTLNKYKVESKNEAPLILWNHRWEYDKNPEEFFQCLFEIAEEGIPFRLAVVGKDYERKPDIFNKAQERLRKQIVRWGYIENPKEYYKILWEADIIPVTSNQDFFGISIVEAIASRCFPLLPIRLCYSEHLSPMAYPECYYQEGQLKERLVEVIENKSYLDCDKYVSEIQKYNWVTLVQNYDINFENLSA